MLKYDTEEKFMFCPLQSETAKVALQQLGEEQPYKDSVYLLQEGKVYIKSSAVLKIVTALPGLWKTFYIGYFFPKCIRDMMYDGIARYRYALFGKRDRCRVPDEKIKRRFLG